MRNATYQQKTAKRKLIIFVVSLCFVSLFHTYLFALKFRKKCNLFELVTRAHLSAAVDADSIHINTHGILVFFLLNFCEGKRFETDFTVVRDTSLRDNPILMNEKPAKTQATEYVSHNSYGIFIQTHVYIHTYIAMYVHASAFIGDGGGAAIIHTVFPYMPY